MHPSRPFLFLDQSERDRIRRRIRECDWARQTWAEIRKEAAAFLERPIRCPAIARCAILEYTCEQRHPLTPDPDRPGVHLCRQCGKKYRGERYERGYANHCHHELAQAAQDSALVGVIEQDQRFLQKAREILLAYAAAFPAYPRQPGSPILSVGRSEEAMIFLPMSFAYDLLAGASVLSGKDTQTIERNLLRPGMEDLLLGTGEAGTALSNHAQWALAGAAIVALSLQDDDAFHRARRNPSGFIAGFTHGLCDDAHWWEGSIGYHFHTLWAFVLIAEAGRHTAHDLYRSEYRDKLREMFLAPLRLAGSDCAFPAVNDSPRLLPSEWTGALALYEVALARFGDPEFAYVLEEAYRDDPLRRANSIFKSGWGNPRTGFFPVTLLYGVDEIPKGKPIQRHSRVLPQQGFVRLGGDPGFEKPYLMLTYGEQDAGHKHAGRLGFLYEYDGVPLLADSGYGFASWKNTAIAHNTVVTDETSHGPTRGRLRGFLNLPWAKVLRSTAEETCLAQGVTLERVQALLPDCLIDLFHVRGDRKHTFDSLLHSPAEWQTDVATKAASGPAFGSVNYQPLESRRAGKVAAPWSATLGNAEAVFPMGNPMEFVIARTKADLNLLALRRKGTSAVFASVILPFASSHVVRRISLKGQERWIAIELRRTDGTRILFSWDSDPTLPPRTLGDTKVRSRVAVLALDREGRVRETALLDCAAMPERHPSPGLSPKGRESTTARLRIEPVNLFGVPTLVGSDRPSSRRFRLKSVHRTPSSLKRGSWVGTVSSLGRTAPKPQRPVDGERSNEAVRAQTISSPLGGEDQGEGCCSRELAESSVIHMQLVPEAAALHPGQFRSFDLCCYDASPAHKKVRVSTSDGLKVSAIKWKQKKQVWCGRFNVAAPKATKPGLERIEVRAKESLIAPIAILPPPVSGIRCVKLNVGGRLRRATPTTTGARNSRPSETASHIHNDPRWESAPSFYVPVVANQVQRAFTQVQTFFDDAAIHFQLTCGEPRMKNLVLDGKADNPLSLFSDDHIEILLDTDGDPATYFQIGVNAAGLGHLNPFGISAGDVRWNHAVRRFKDRWETFVTISFSNWVVAPKVGDRWKVNIVRLRCAAGREDSAMVMGPGGYHCPQEFLPLKFVGK